MEILKFIFSSFWIWLGTLVLVAAPIAVLAEAFVRCRCRGEE